MPIIAYIILFRFIFIFHLLFILPIFMRRRAAISPRRATPFFFSLPTLISAPPPAAFRRRPLFDAAFVHFRFRFFFAYADYWIFRR